MGFIYVIRNNKNSLVYVGQTVKRVEKRFLEHLSRSRYKESGKLYKAIREIGEDNFYIEILGEYADNELNNMEEYWISKLDSFNNGYNSNIGGGFSYNAKGKDVDKITELAKSGMTLNEISDILNIPKSYIRKFYNFEDNISSYVQTNDSKAIDMYDCDYNYIRTYKSIGEAFRDVSKDRKINRSNFYSRVKEACKFDKVVYNYRWRFKGDKANIKKNANEVRIYCPLCGKLKSIENELCYRCMSKRQDNVYDKNTITDNCTKRVNNASTTETSELKKELIAQLNLGKNMEDIGRHFGVSSNSIRKWCKKFGIDRQKKHIVLVELNQTYDSWSDAAEYLINIGIGKYKNKYTLGYRLKKIYENGSTIGYRGIHIKLI